MSRERKTIDVWRLYVNYCGEWEHELDEYTPEEARKRRREYAENCPQYPVKVLRGREPVRKRYFYGTNEINGYRPYCGLLRQQSDPTGKFRTVYVYGRPLETRERDKGGLEYIKTEEKETDHE